jgi:hypothetical protein
LLLVPEDSIFILTGGNDKKLNNVSRDEALSILTEGVPSLSILHENRRQIFVESQYDAHNYEKIYLYLKQKLIPEISLNFIPSGKGLNGSCEQVSIIVSQLRKAGNNQISGVIDWDKKNNRDKGLVVLGENQRYSIENYIFDPIALAIYLIREQLITTHELNIDEEQKYWDFPRFGNDTLQIIVDSIIDIIFPYKSDCKNRSCKYMNKKLVQIPIWYLEMQGHDLETQIINKFPKLKRFKRGNDLKSDLISKVFNDIPELIPEDFFILFETLQQNN